MLPAISNRDPGDEHTPPDDGMTISDCAEEEAWREHTEHRIVDMEAERVRRAESYDPWNPGFGRKV